MLSTVARHHPDSLVRAVFEEFRPEKEPSAKLTAALSALSSLGELGFKLLLSWLNNSNLAIIFGILQLANGNQDSKPHLSSILTARWREIVSLCGIRRTVQLCQELGNISEPALREMLSESGRRVFESQDSNCDLSTEYSTILNAWLNTGDPDPLGAVALAEHWLLCGISDSLRAFVTLPVPHQEHAIQNLNDRRRKWTLNAEQSARALKLAAACASGVKFTRMSSWTEVWGEQVFQPNRGWGGYDSDKAVQIYSVIQTGLKWRGCFLHPDQWDRLSLAIADEELFQTLRRLWAESVKPIELRDLAPSQLPSQDFFKL